MSPEYLSLAAERASAKCAPHRQPEDFGYDFRGWVSPYTKGANKTGGVALVLQDWASTDDLDGGLNPETQRYGRTPEKLTNRRLVHLLHMFFGLDLAEVYATNIFPFVKAGSASARLRRREVLGVARRFAIRELELARPSIILSLGAVAYSTLSACGVASVPLPHPAARIGGVARHEEKWRLALRPSA